MVHMEVRNRSKETASGPESSFSLTRQAQTNRYDRRIVHPYLARFVCRALFLYQGGYPKLDKDFAGYPPTPPENSILIKTLAVAT